MRHVQHSSRAHADRRSSSFLTAASSPVDASASQQYSSNRPGRSQRESKPVEPPTKVVSLDMNRGLLVQMLRGAVDSKIDFNPKIFHQKFVIRDPGKPRAAVLTGSTNFTVTDTHRNLNHMAIFHHDGVVTAYQTEFDQLWDGIFGARSPKLTTNDPFKFVIEGAEVQIAFSPDNNPELRVVNEILKAQRPLTY
jgi:hypothetical protein